MSNNKFRLIQGGNTPPSTPPVQPIKFSDLSHVFVMGAVDGFSRALLMDERPSELQPQMFGAPIILPAQPLEAAGFRAQQFGRFSSGAVSVDSEGGTRGAGYYLFGHDAGERQVPEGILPAREVVVLIGLPGSGKTTWIRDNLPKHIRISHDELSASLTGDWKRSMVGVYHMVEEFIARTALMTGYNIVIDRTNYHEKTQERWRYIAESTGADIRFVHVTCSVNTCVERMKERPVNKQVPRERIEQMARDLSVPAEREIVEGEAP